jgi:hypothetical protein
MNPLYDNATYYIPDLPVGADIDVPMLDMLNQPTHSSEPTGATGTTGTTTTQAKINFTSGQWQYVPATNMYTLYLAGVNADTEIYRVAGGLTQAVATDKDLTANGLILTSFSPFSGFALT